LVRKPSPPTHKKFLFCKYIIKNSPHAPFLPLFLPLHLSYSFTFHFPPHSTSLSSVFFRISLPAAEHSSHFCLQRRWLVFHPRRGGGAGTYFPICICSVKGSLILSYEIWNPISLSISVSKSSSFGGIHIYTAKNCVKNKNGCTLTLLRRRERLLVIVSALLCLLTGIAECGNIFDL
jgi:hypothetical protein